MTDDRSTRVELEHRGLEAYGAHAAGMRDILGSANGGPGMLDEFAQVAGRHCA